MSQNLANPPPPKKKIGGQKRATLGSTRQLQTSIANISGTDRDIFGPQLFFGGGPPKFRDLDYKTEKPPEHVAKFRDDRPTQLGDFVANKMRKKKRNISSKT